MSWFRDWLASLTGNELRHSRFGDECPASNVRAFADELAEQRRRAFVEAEIDAGIARCREQRLKRSAAARKGIENARRKQGEN